MPYFPMTFPEHRQVLLTALREIITNDYILLDVPHYTNVGDVLLWEATLQLLKKMHHRCIYSCSIETYQKPKISNNTILLFSGGGNFGDLWQRHQTFRHLVMKDFPENPIVQLPQSVWFSNPDKLQQDIDCFRHHNGHITICLRDKQSVDFIQQNYPFAESRLLPDLALAVDMDRVLRRNRLQQTYGEGTLFLQRKDKERAHENVDFTYDAEGDWPSMSFEIRLYRWYISILQHIQKNRITARCELPFTNFFYRLVLKDAYLRNGIRYILPYHTVYTNRLHAAILALMLGKDVKLIDNSYRKNSGVYQLWLKDIPNITLL